MSMAIEPINAQSHAATTRAPRRCDQTKERRDKRTHSFVSLAVM
jgi:hypothetical protein